MHNCFCFCFPPFPSQWIYECNKCVHRCLMVSVLYVCMLVTEELLMCFRFMCVSCSGLMQSRSLPVLGSARPPVVLCPITLQSSAFTAYSKSGENMSLT